MFAQLDVELTQHRHARKANRNIVNLGKSLIRVADFVALKNFHLSRISCEVFGEGGFLTELDWEVLTNIAEVFEQKWLLSFFQFYLVAL